jgi:hypothetical protein
MSEQRVHYLHYLNGGPENGNLFPAQRRYFKLSVGFYLYCDNVIDKNAIPCDSNGSVDFIDDPLKLDKFLRIDMH